MDCKKCNGSGDIFCVMHKRTGKIMAAKWSRVKAPAWQILDIVPCDLCVEDKNG